LSLATALVSECMCDTIDTETEFSCFLEMPNLRTTRSHFLYSRFANFIYNSISWFLIGIRDLSTYKHSIIPDEASLLTTVHSILTYDCFIPTDRPLRCLSHCPVSHSLSSHSQFRALTPDSIWPSSPNQQLAVITRTA